MKNSLTLAASLAAMGASASQAASGFRKMSKALPSITKKTAPKDKKKKRKMVQASRRKNRK